jgi:phosphatidate cytidylyltransferase
MTRILTSMLLVPFGIGSVFFTPQPLFIAIVCGLAFACHREYCRLSEDQGVPSMQWPALAVGIALLLTPRLELAYALPLAVVTMSLALRIQDFKSGFASAGSFLLGIFYIFGAWRAAIGLRELSSHWLFFALAINWAGDVTALYVGRAWGKHKLAPRVSPAKSVEGALASVVASTLFGCLYLPYVFPELPLGLAATYSILGNIAGQLGDLAESALKRGANKKDSGAMLPGHGGWLDRLDSSLFSMPTVYCLISLTKLIQ